MVARKTSYLLCVFPMFLGSLEVAGSSPTLGTFLPFLYSALSLSCRSHRLLRVKTEEFNRADLNVKIYFDTLVSSRLVGFSADLRIHEHIFLSDRDGRMGRRSR